MCFGPVGPNPKGRGGPGVVLEVRAAQMMRFWENFIKLNLSSIPWFSVGGSGQIRSWTQPRVPAAVPSSRGRSTAMIPWAIELVPTPGLNAAGEQPKQLKFVMVIAAYFSNHNFFEPRKENLRGNFKVSPGTPG